MGLDGGQPPDSIQVGGESFPLLTGTPPGSFSGGFRPGTLRGAADLLRRHQQMTSLSKNLSDLAQTWILLHQLGDPRFQKVIREGLESLPGFSFQPDEPEPAATDVLPVEELIDLGFSGGEGSEATRMIREED